jgi:hypothetical protein
MELTFTDGKKFPLCAAEGNECVVPDTKRPS